MKNIVSVATRNAFSRACADSCESVLRQLNRVKSAIFSESRAALNAPQHLLRLVLNEAEAESWQTEYPHLVFPTLATEKIQSLAAWNHRQQALRRASSAAFAQSTLNP
ncbi:MAG: hypothetical protein RLY20_1762 [Verrucomicrobiota bacterium]